VTHAENVANGHLGFQGKGAGKRKRLPRIDKTWTGA